MARYGAMLAGFASDDLRCAFPINGNNPPLPAEEDAETYPYIWFSFGEAADFCYRVAKIQVDVNLIFSGGPSNITASEEQWMRPNLDGEGDERLIPHNAFGLGLLGSSFPDQLPSLGIASYKPSDQTFRMSFLYVTDLAHSAVGTVTSTDPGEYAPVGATLSIFGHETPMTYPTILGPAPSVSGGITVTPILWREYRDSSGNNPRYNAATGAVLISGRVPGY